MPHECIAGRTCVDPIEESKKDPEWNRLSEEARERIEIDIEAYADGRRDAIADIREKAENIADHIERIVCDCGEPYKGTDVDDACQELLAKLDEMI